MIIKTASAYYQNITKTLSGTYCRGCAAMFKTRTFITTLKRKPVIITVLDKSLTVHEHN